MCRLLELGLGWGIVWIGRKVVDLVYLRMLLGESTSLRTVGQGCRREGDVAGRVGRTTVVGPSEPWVFRLIEKW